MITKSHFINFWYWQGIIIIKGKSWRENIFKWYKKFYINSLSGNYTPWLGLVNKYNSQVWFGTWDVNVNLLLKTEFVIFIFYFKYFNYTVSYCNYYI
jgi:hypothetical protein